MRDFKTRESYARRVDIITDIRDNDAIGLGYKWLIADLSEFLLPENEGGTYKAALHPGIYDRRRFDMTDKAARYGIDEDTLRSKLDTLEAACVIERSYIKSDRKMNLCFINAMPLLARPQHIVLGQKGTKKGYPRKIR